MKSKLLKNKSYPDLKNLSGLFYIIAQCIEDSICLSEDIEPGVDYSLLDLYKLAQPFVLEIFKDKKINLRLE